MAIRSKKHPCLDCKHCQWCSDDRCRLCLRPGRGGKKKLSITEQIAFFERLNRESEECRLSHLGESGPPLEEGGASPCAVNNLEEEINPPEIT